MLSIDPVEVICVNGDDTPWIATDDTGATRIKYFHINPSKGEIVLLAHIKAGTRSLKHYHAGQVVVYTVSGYWEYAEHDWVAGPGSVVYETASSTHQPIIHPEEDVVALNIIQGDVDYFDASGAQVRKENVNTALRRYLSYCERSGIAPRDLTTFRRSAPVKTVETVVTA
jgi:quercetin dioxygenase-like cupin family protein